MQWLESIGGTQVDWKALTMKFQLGGISVILQGYPTLSTSLVSLKALWKAIRDHGEGVLLELGNIGVVEQTVDTNIFESIQLILDQLQSVFHTPTVLLPPRSRDHAITLQLGTPLINVR